MSVPSRAGSVTPGRSAHGDQTPRRDDSPSGTPTRRTPRTPRTGRATPAESVGSEVSTPLRWGATGATSTADELSGLSPAPSIIPRSPAEGLSEVDLSSPLNYGTPSSMGSIRSVRSGIRGTPIRTRPDVRSNKQIRQVNVGSDALEAIPESQESGASSAAPHLVIWGTNVSVADCKEKFKQFILRYIEPEAEEDEYTESTNLNEPLYLQKLEDIKTLEEPVLNINCSHLETFDKGLYRQLICYPQEVIPIFDMTINDMFYERYPSAVLDHQIEVRPYNAEKVRDMRSLNPEDIDQLVTINGMVIRTSDVIPDMRKAFFKCIVCSFTTAVEVLRGHIAEPTLCVNCNTNHCFTLIHNRSHFTDKQMIRLQESQGDLPIRPTTHTVVLFAHSDLVDTVQPGNRVTVTGIYRAQPVQANPRTRNVRTVYKTHIDVLHFRKIDSKRLHEEEEGKSHRFTPERIELLENLSRVPDVYYRLASSLAPAVFGNEDIKKGILLQLLGGTKKTFSAYGRSNFRAEIHILLCGDPGTSKSQLLQYAYNLIPRSQYTSGKGSSAVGLTAYIDKDMETGQLVLQSGALVLADNGICCIDEFDKMDQSTRSILHEVMEQQTLSIAKAGIICQLNARTSILAGANPAESQWNKNKTITENIRLPHTLISRFDLIFLMLDPQNDFFDRSLAKHLVSLYYKTTQSDKDGFLDMSILKDYVVYAKEHVHPKLNEEAQQKLIQAYVDMRKIGSGRGKISAYPRQLESLIRLAEAHAKVRFSQIVTPEDVEEACRLYREALKQSATDPLTGKIDVSIIMTGISSATRKRKFELTTALRKLIETKGNVVLINNQKLLAELRENSVLMITRQEYEDSLKDLQEEGVIVVLSDNIKVCGNR